MRPRRPERLHRTAYPFGRLVLAYSCILYHRRSPLPPRGYGLPFIGDTFAAIAEGPRGAGLPHHKRLGSIYRCAHATCSPCIPSNQSADIAAVQEHGLLGSS